MFTRDIGVDLGTANTLVCVKGKGIIMREPSVVAYDIRSDAVRAVGTEAKEMIGRTPGSIIAVRPLKDGVIADFDVTAAMLKRFVRQALKGSVFSRVRMVVCIPAGVTEVESRAVFDAAKQAGATDVDLVEEPMAAAVGAPRCARQVGWALHVNPEPGVIPCHRVVNREGRLAPAFAFGGPDVQASLLEAEGVQVEGGYVDLSKYRWEE